MKSFLRLGAGLLRALVAMAVGLISLFALFLEIFFPSGKGASEKALEDESARDFRDTCGMSRPNELGRYAQPGDPDY